MLASLPSFMSLCWCCFGRHDKNSALGDAKFSHLSQAHRGMAFEIVAGAADTVRYAGEMVGLFKPRPPVALAAHHRSSSGRSKPRRSREQSSPGGRANSVGTVQRRHVVAEGGSERGGGDVGIEPAGRDREGAGASEEMHGGGVSSRPPCSADGDGGGQGCEKVERAKEGCEAQ
jgi:hypothetical protein